MFHAYIIPIATCFIYTSYHFYAFSGTNLLTRCHSASSLFSAVFGFRKVLLQIFSELHETKGQVPIFPTPSRSPKERRRRAPRWPNHTPAQWAPLPRRPMVWAPRASTDVAPSPIYWLRRENPKRRSQFPRRDPQRRRHRRQVSGDRSLCSGTLPGWGIAPGVISISSTTIFIAAADSHDEEGVVLPRG